MGNGKSSRNVLEADARKAPRVREFPGTNVVPMKAKGSLVLTGSIHSLGRLASSALIGALLVVPIVVDARTAASQTQVREGAEPLLNKALDEIGKQRFDSALSSIDQLLRVQPNFRLAHLIKGDLLLAKVQPLTQLGSASRGPEDRVGDLREEAIARLRALRDRDRKSTRLNSSHSQQSRMPSSA